MNHYSCHGRTWIAYLFVSIAFLYGCSNSGTHDLETYVQKVKARQHPRVEPLPEFVPYETFLYRAQNLRDPFTPPSVEASTAVAQAIGNGIYPEAGRRKEPLESHPLDSLRMVGTLDRADDTWALVRTSDGTIHRVQPGNHLGQNHGKITAISESSVNLTEILPDGLGGWIERAASLALSE